MSGFDGPRPPSPAQEFLTRLRGSVEEISRNLHQTLHKARGEGLVTEDGPAMELFGKAANNLSTAQHLATTLATHIERAEHFLFGFKAAVGQHTQIAFGAIPSGFGKSSRTRGRTS